MTLDLARVRRRRGIMLAINSLAVLAAATAAIGYFGYGQSWGLLVFAGALLVGFGAQVWFIAGLRGPRKGV